MRSSPSRVLLPHSHAGVYSRAQQGGCVVSRPHTLCSPLCLIQFPIHTQLGVQLPLKLGVRFFMWHFSSPRRGAATLFFTWGPWKRDLCTSLD